MFETQAGQAEAVESEKENETVEPAMIMNIKKELDKAFHENPLWEDLDFELAEEGSDEETDHLKAIYNEQKMSRRTLSRRTLSRRTLPRGRRR